MRLTDHTDYSLRVLMVLNCKKTLITLNELSDLLRVSKNNLIKVSNQLVKLKLVESVKGRFGGLKIIPESGNKTLKEIIVNTEESFSMAECYRDKNCGCTLVNNCYLKPILKQALENFLNTLDGKTLNDITPKFI